jgi:molybdopterin biosynthesis enzyme MoaB
MDSNGRIGIGKTNPAYNLDVFGIVRAGSTLASSIYLTNSEVKWRGDGTAHFSIFNQNSTFQIRSTSANFEPGTAGSNLVTVTATGSVGIGKTNPSTALDVTGTVTATTFSGSAASLTGFPTFNQNTTGTAAGLSATLAVTSGGTGATTAQTAINSLAGAVTSAQYLRGDGTNILMSAIQAADVPPLNQNTTGTAAGLSTTLAITSGGTGSTTASDSFNALSPMTTAGDLIYGGASGTGTRLAPNSTATLKFMSQTSSTPSWVTLSATDLPTVAFSPGAAGTYGSSTAIPSIVVDTYGRITGISTSSISSLSGLTAYGVLYATSATAATTTAVGSAGQPLLSSGAGVAPTYGTLGVSNGGTGATTTQAAINALAGAVTNAQYLRGNGTNILMSAIQASDVPTLNQNTTGTAAGLSATLALTSGGTGATSAQAAINSLAGSVTSAQYLRGNGTNILMSAIQAADVPTLNQNTTGTAAGLSATLALTSGGTGATSAQAARNALAGAVTNAQYLRGNGTNILMSAIQAADVPTLNQNTTGTAAGLSATLALTSGGTGATSAQTAINSLAGSVTNAQFLRGNGTNVVMAAISASDVPTLNQNTTGSAATATTATNQSGGTVSCTSASSTGYIGTAMVPGVATRSTGGFYLYNDGNFNIEMMQRTSGVYGLNFITRNTDGVFSWRKTGGAADWGTELMFLNNAGNLGIGTTNPSAKLHIQGNGGDGAPLRLVNASASPSEVAIGFYRNSNQSSAVAGDVWVAGINPYSVGDRNFGIGCAYKGLIVSILATGNVGIGTTNPAKPLHVWGGMIIGASSDSRATTVTLNAPGATVTFSPNNDIGDGARIMCLQCPDLSSTTANLVSFSLQVAPTGSFGTQRTSLDLKGFRVANQNYGGFCLTSAFDVGGSYDLLYTDRTKAYFQQNLGIGTSSPSFKLHVSAGDSSFSYHGPNATWGASLKVGAGSTYAASGVASVVVTDGNLHIDSATNAKAIYLNFFQGGGSGGVNTTVGCYAAFTATGDITAFSSDERLKTKVGLIENALDKVCSLTAFRYTHNETARKNGFTDNNVYVGLSAQEVQKVLPEVVKPAPFDQGTEYDVGLGKSRSGENYLTVQYERIVSLLVEAVKEERAERLKVEERLARLEKLLVKE